MTHEWWDFPEDPVKSDFRNFLFLTWDHLGLPEPTEEQYDFGYFLQHGYSGYYELSDGSFVKRYDQAWYDLTEDQRSTAVILESPKSTGRADILEAFRGAGKSFVSAAYVLWCLYRDPVNEKILVVSASSTKAKEFVAMCGSIMESMELLAGLRPRGDQLNQADRFNVNGASISQSPSLKAAGITGQITGSRATRIIPDDIEAKDNSFTEDQRKKLLTLVSEFDAIIMPGPKAQICFLGTPQTEESMYNRLIKERGFNCYCFPARYPKLEKRESYVLKRDDGVRVDTLAPELRVVDKQPTLSWKPSAPARFGETELMARESKGRSFFMLQYMLDTSLSDAERYPLKQRDLIVISVNRDKAPMTIQWGKHTDGKNVRNDIPNVGFSGDHFMGPLFVDPEWRPYAASVLFVDPSGRGKDETAWAIVKELFGYFYLLRVGGVAGDPATAMAKIAKDAYDFNVNEIVVEPNYGGVVWINAFQPILAKAFKVEQVQRKVRGDREGFVALRSEGASVSCYEAEWSKGMKEARIIDTLEPVIAQHRLIVDEACATDQVLMYQMTHIAAERNCLSHDDRIESVAGAINRLANALLQDGDEEKQGRKDEELDEELRDFIETCHITTGRGIRTGRNRRNGKRIEAVE